MTRERPSHPESRRAPSTVPWSGAPSELGLEAEQMHAELQARMFAVEPAPLRLGRFVVLERLGSGGMGVVYAAYDPTLDRKIAVKLVRPELVGDVGMHALVEEAKALARLSHPNVIAVHDVGNIGDQVFIAMEYVEGVPLSRWVVEQPRTWRAILAVYIAAAHGLAAAHLAGLVHRDFKPDNVLVTADPGKGLGRVRVLDFGLALRSAPPGAGDNERIAIAGTPLYMSPEQLLGEAIDARSDQYSFCVALFEALYGEHPYRGATVEDTAVAAIEGIIRSAARKPDVPRQIRAALLRGMSRSPGDRFADMEALVHALGEPSRPSRARRLALFGLVPGFLALGYVAALARSGEEPCRASARRLDGIWDRERAAALRAAFVETETAAADDAAERATAALDRYAELWERVHRETCEATAVHHEQSIELLDVRMHCLDRRLAEMQQVVAVLVAADDAVVGNAVAAVLQLDAPGECALRSATRADRGRPLDAAVYQRLDELQARAKALVSTGSYTEAEASTREALAAARESGDARRIAEVLLLLGELHMHADDATASVPVLDEAIVVAEVGTHDDLRADALAQLAMASASREDFPAALRFGAFAEAAIERIDPSTRERVALESMIGYLHLRAGDHRAALARLEAAAARLREIDDEPLAATTLNTLALVQRDIGDDTIALENFERARGIRSRIYGDAHPQTAIIVFNIATVLTRIGRHEQAVAHYRSLVEIYGRTLGPECLDVGYTLDSMAISLFELGQSEQALAYHRRAQTIFEKHDPDARAELAMSLVNIGTVLRETGRVDEALEHHRRALRLWEERIGPDHVDVSFALVAIAEDLLALDRHVEAAPLFDRALALRGTSGIFPAAVLEARFGLARALVGSDRARATVLAEQALGEARGIDDSEQAARIEAFLHQSR